MTKKPGTTLNLNLDDALSGRAKLAGIQWLLLSPGPRQALRHQLKSLLTGRSTLGPCRLLRARFKPGRKLKAYYEALVRMQGRATYCARPIAVTWGADDETDWLAEAGVQAEAQRRGLAAPFGQLTADLMQWRMHLSISPMDTHFSQLVRLVDPRYVRDMLSAVYPMNRTGSDRSHPGASVITSIRYRPGQRHVLRYDCLDGSNGTAFAKLYTDIDGARAFHVATRVSEWLAQHVGFAAAVRPLAYVVEDKVVLYPGLKGVPLSQALRHRGRGLVRRLERTGAALSALHLLPPTAAGSLPTHDFQAEVGQTARASAHILVLLPSVGKAIEALLERARQLHERLPQEPSTFTHGDFKPEHVWCGANELTLLDFDSSHCGDPALDVGKFLAHLQLWYVLNNQPGLRLAQERFLAGYAGSVPDGRLLRAHLYEAVELVKITGRRVPLFDPNWVSRTERLIGRAHLVLNDLQRGLGLPGSSSHCVDLATDIRSGSTATPIGNVDQRREENAVNALRPAA